MKKGETVEQYQSRRYREERYRDAWLYILMLSVIVIGFSSTKFLSIASLIPVSVILIWVLGIKRQSDLQTKSLIEAEPLVKKLMAKGMTEHEAMLELEMDRFYYRPFWAIK